MIWSFYVSLRGRAAAFVVAVVFILIALATLIFAPVLVAFASDKGLASWSARTLGIVFLGLGIGALILGIGDVYLERTNPARRARWFWWGNFILGVIGALLFAIPATLLFPIFLILYWLKPNALFPSSVDPANNLLVSLLFSVIGIVVLILLYFVARSRYRERPQDM